MKAIFRNKRIMLTVLALALVLSATIGTSLAYFTTFTSANGRRPISLGTTTTVNEPPSGKDKVISITNDKDSNDAYVRVRAYAGSDIKVDYSGEGWIDGNDGWHYYNKILPPGETTSDLTAAVSIPAGSELSLDQFQVVVVHESIQAFDPQIGPMDPNAGWDERLEIEGGDK